MEATNSSSSSVTNTANYDTSICCVVGYKDPIIHNVSLHLREQTSLLDLTHGLDHSIFARALRVFYPFRTLR